MDDSYTLSGSSALAAAPAVSVADKPESVDLSHHLSELAKARISSPLKVRGLQRRTGSAVRASADCCALRLR